MTVRQRLDERHQAIQSDIVRMGGMARDMIRLAIEAVLNGDIALARSVIASDDDVDSLEKETMRTVVMSVGLEAPVAGDLMMLVGTMGVIGEIEKVADDAVKLARRATKLAGYFPSEMKLALNQMGEAANRMFMSAIKLYVDYSHDLADQIVLADEGVDKQYVEARARVFELIRKDPGETEHLVRTIEAFHALEHVADHAVEIARRLRLQYGE